MATARHLVVLASAESQTTDALADVLRDTCTVRTAYAVTEVLDRLDADVDVVLLDLDLAGDPVDLVAEVVSERGLDCQIGVLAEADRPADPRVDAAVAPDAPAERIRDQVAVLGTRARYARTLDAYFDLAQTAAEGSGDAASLDADRERFQARLADLEARLDETADTLDTESLFEAVLDTRENP